MGTAPGPNTPTYPLNAQSTFGAMPDGHYFEAKGFDGAFVKQGEVAQPSRIWTWIQPIPDALPVKIPPETPVSYFDGKR